MPKSPADPMGREASQVTRPLPGESEVADEAACEAQLARLGRTRAERSRCRIAHAVWYEPISRVY